MLIIEEEKMNKLKSLALRVAAAEFHYQRLKDSQSRPHVAKANRMRYVEALAEFKQAAKDINQKKIGELLRWAKEVVAARAEMHEKMQDSPPVRLFQLLMGYNKFWCFAGHELTQSKFPYESVFCDKSLEEIIQFVLGSPERELAMEALVQLAGVSQNWSLGPLVDIRVAINEVKRKQQGSFSKAEVVEILEAIIEAANADE